MTNVSKEPEKISIRGFLFQAAVEALQANGWKVEKARGLGKGSVRRITRHGESKLCSIRTTQDQAIAFPRNENDDGWSTLADVDMVVAASVDKVEQPTAAVIHLFDADMVRKRFDSTYAARMAAGHSIPVGRGVWLPLYKRDDETPSFAFGGIGSEFPPISIVPFSKLDPAAVSDAAEESDVSEGSRAEQEAPARLTTPALAVSPAAPLTIPEAKRRLAEAFGVSPENVKITIEA